MSDLPTPPPSREITPEDLFQDGLMQILRERLQLSIGFQTFLSSAGNGTTLELSVVLLDKGNPNVPPQQGQSLATVCMATTQLRLEIQPPQAPPTIIAR